MWKIEGEVLVNVYTFVFLCLPPFFASLLRGGDWKPEGVAQQQIFLLPFLIGSL